MRYYTEPIIAADAVLDTGELSYAGGRPTLLFGRVEWSEILGLKTDYTEEHISVLSDNFVSRDVYD